MVNINNVAIFITFFTDGKTQLNCAHVLIKMHPTFDQNMGNKPMLVQNFNEQPLVPLNLFTFLLLVVHSRSVSFGGICAFIIYPVVTQVP